MSPKSQALRGSISKSSMKYKNKTKEPISRLLTEVCLWFLHKQVNIWVKVFIAKLFCHNVIVYKGKKKKTMGARAMAQMLRELAALPEDLSLVLGTHDEHSN